MDERSRRWPNRATSGVALVHLAYVAVPVLVIASGIGEVASDLADGDFDGGTELVIGISLPGLIGAALVGLAIVSPVLTWLTCLAVGLWRGRRWAWVGGFVTFAITALLFPAMAAAGDAPAENLPLALALSAPSGLGLVVLAGHRGSFRPSRSSRRG